MESKVTIKIPRQLYHQLSLMVAETGFNSVTDLIVFAMRSIASGGQADVERLTGSEVSAIRERLRRLGYLED